ncbi:MAG: DUF1361 domain-containing protein [Hormoscilla sp. GM7CHS1pb]|nr:DUF1361 domain-containing protein [Hormoscilla sp. GM7CHS1pb]
MKVQLFNWLALAWDILLKNSPWMGWNLFLAFIPLFLSFWLFHSTKSRSLLWWAACLFFVAFLPNAPYVLTDIIHLIEDIRQNYFAWLVTLVLIPLYMLFIFLGFEAYVLSLLNLGHYFQQQGWVRFILPAELCLHSLSAIGIYLGRFLRFNSWDIVTRLDTLTAAILDDVLAKWPLLVIAVTFVAIAGLYWLMKQVTLGVILRFRQFSVTA